jgi:uncharacterized membrane protein YbhN (UPF0104 family)
MAGTVVLETLASLATAGAVAALLSVGPWASPSLRKATQASPYTLPLIAVTVAGVLALAIVELKYYPRFVLRVLRMEPSERPLLPWSWLVGCTISWLCVGAACALCALGLSEGRDTALLVAAVGVLGPIVGFLVMVAPGGLGAREAFLVLVLEPQIGTTRALALGLVSRAVTLATEFVLWVVARVALAMRQKK